MSLIWLSKKSLRTLSTMYLSVMTLISRLLSHKLKQSSLNKGTNNWSTNWRHAFRSSKSRPAATLWALRFDQSRSKVGVCSFAQVEATCTSVNFCFIMQSLSAFVSAFKCLDSTRLTNKWRWLRLSGTLILRKLSKSSWSGAPRTWTTNLISWYKKWELLSRNLLPDVIVWASSKSSSLIPLSTTALGQTRVQSSLGLH